MHQKPHLHSRREFLTVATASAASLALVPATALGIPAALSGLPRDIYYVHAECAHLDNTRAAALCGELEALLDLGTLRSEVTLGAFGDGAGAVWSRDYTGGARMSIVSTSRCAPDRVLLTVRGRAAHAEYVL